jgi:exfoliative toxin A/B
VNTFLKKVPMPIVGVMLSFAVLGNLVQSYGEVYRNILGIISAIIFIITTIKFLSDLKGLKNDLDTPIGGSVFLTYTMGIMILATYIKPYNNNAAFGVWIAGVILHLVFLLRFTFKFIGQFKIKQVFPSWFIVYVGIAAAAVTGKAFQPAIGQIAFWFSFICYIILIFVVGKRVFIVKEIPEPALPTLVIFAAPGSLCLAGYLNSFDTKNMIIFWLLLILSQGFYLFAISRLAGLLKLKFYPSYSAFTFPMVISALALKLSNGFLIKQGFNTGILPVIVKIEEAIAVVLVFYVLIRYIVHISTVKVNGLDVIKQAN